MLYFGSGYWFLLSNSITVQAPDSLQASFARVLLNNYQQFGIEQHTTQVYVPVYYAEVLIN